MGAPIAVKNQGHQMVLPEAGEAVLITTCRLSGVSVRAATRTIAVGAGARWSEVPSAAARYGLAPHGAGRRRGRVHARWRGRSAGYAAVHVQAMDCRHCRRRAAQG
ncbi:FAD-binding protein [Actinacidiphila guanduensis]|uniref:FAD-binding protein n=1 Tax=Actinacidiphila guanduensis TaxID=310781 RepID=UPI003898D787